MARCVITCAGGAMRSSGGGTASPRSVVLVSLAHEDDAVDPPALVVRDVE
jgi:hypothetical protein